jgi:hypothetical protein
VNVVPVDTIDTIDGRNSAALNGFDIVPVTHAFEGVYSGAVPYVSWGTGSGELVAHESEFTVQRTPSVGSVPFVPSENPLNQSAIQANVSSAETFVDVEELLNTGVLTEFED